MSLPDKIETGRLLLRPLVAADEAAWLAALNRPELAHWLSAPPFPYTAADFAAFLAAAPGRALWVIEDAEGVAGSVALNPHLGYWVAPRAQGRGYAQQAAEAVLAAHFAQAEAEGDAVKSGYFEGNAASARVLAKLGFVEIGRGPEFCRPLSRDRAHVTMHQTRAAWAADHPFTLATARLWLDPVQLTDAPAIRRIVTDPRVGRMLFVFPPDLDLAAAEDMARRWAWRGTPPFRLALRDAAGGALVGTIGLKSLDQPEIYYFLAPERHGQGLMREALAAFLPAITRRFGLSQLSAKVFDDNPASARLLAAQGFRPTSGYLQATPARPEPAPARVFLRP